MPAAQFMAVFGPYAARIDQILYRFDPAELHAAAVDGRRHRRRNPLAPGGTHRMTTTTAPQDPPRGARSPFAGADICHEAGLMLPDGAARPMFDDDLWDFTDVVGLPVQMALYRRRFDFTTIADPRWRLVAKELILALLAPSHPAVAPLPRAYRAPLHLTQLLVPPLRTGRFFGWLDRRGIATLAAIDTRVCEDYLAFRRYVSDDDGAVVGEQQPGCSARGSTNHRRPGRLPGSVHRRSSPARLAAMGRRDGFRGRRNALRQRRKQDPSSRCRDAAADAGRRAAPGARSSGRTPSS